MIKVKVTQLKSGIDRPKDQKATLHALGLGRINKSRTFEANPALIGMIKKVSHLVKVEEVSE
jgi:large subunit ribosomal protein L30